MKKLTPNDPEMQSADLLVENVERLKALFPEAFTEGRIDFAVLKELLGGHVDEREEKYGINWHGKRQARRLALTPSTGTLRPCPAESVDWQTTQNLMIEGDNLEVLKLLQKSYAGKVKLIYIDPPYNTGKDFVYPDDYRDNLRNYLELTGQVDGEGRRMSSNTEASGRFHTDWLNMMYPRLRLARNLLRADGVILVSIDDAEFSNLRRMLDEVFGEENFLATLVWDRNRKNDAKYFSVGHEYMAVYAKNKGVLSENQIIFRGEKDGVEDVKAEFDRLKQLHATDWTAIREGLLEFYKTISDEDPRAPLKRFTKVDVKGPFRDDGNINWPGGDGPRYEVLHPGTQLPCKLPISGWRYPTRERFWEEVATGRIVFGLDETTVPRVRTNLFENTDQVLVSVHYSYAQTSANEFNALFDGKRIFDNPKPVGDLRRLTGYLTGPDDLVCDFFAGSGTEGHAVIAQNSVDSGNRRYILVQLPEPLDPSNKDQKTAADFCDKLGKPRTIAELTKERLRRAGKKIREENPLFHGDTGFRVFKLDASNLKPWDPNPADLNRTLLDHVDHILPDRSEQDLLFELLLKLGLELTVPMETRTIAQKAVHAIGGGALLVCLAEKITRKEVEPLAQGLLDWRRELAPAVSTTFVFRDSAFDDVAKTNLAAILEQNLPASELAGIRSL
ncbi:MAG: site-specific DNA-methyltransferase [Magnetococcales bacterium]|nr:site-specific DNA-methyltransferase [Magnetococcales bacterium]